MSLRKPGQPKIALALAGGGPLGAIYEIGALCALQDCLKGIRFTRLHHYVGVSAGAFVASALANGIAPRQLCALFIEDRRTQAEAFDPACLLQPAWGEWAARLGLLPQLLANGAWYGLTRRSSWMRTLERLSPALPTGIFSNAQIDAQLTQLFSRPGRSNDFRRLKSRLTLVATHLDSGRAVPFGRAGWDHVPISKAVQASAALPGLFPPVRIDGQDYVDGALLKTLHASIALDEGVDLMLCLNPLVPFDASVPEPATHRPWAFAEPIPRIAAGGLPAVLSQTLRSLIHSRLELGLKHYAQKYPNTDIVLIEPDHRDPELYLANTFSYSQRRHLAEHAYQQTRQLLRARHADLGGKLAYHGIGFDVRALNDPQRYLCAPRRPPRAVGLALNRLSAALDNLGRYTQAAQAVPAELAWL
ncbi:MAG: patatin-like phospholipase family protein [Rhodoferax sp.]